MPDNQFEFRGCSPQSTRTTLRQTLGPHRQRPGKKQRAGRENRAAPKAAARASKKEGRQGPERRSSDDKDKQEGDKKEGGDKDKDRRDDKKDKTAGQAEAVFHLVSGNRDHAGRADALLVIAGRRPVPLRDRRMRAPMMPTPPATSTMVSPRVSGLVTGASGWMTTSDVKAGRNCSSSWTRRTTRWPLQRAHGGTSTNPKPRCSQAQAAVVAGRKRAWSRRRRRSPRPGRRLQPGRGAVPGGGRQLRPQ